MQIKKYELTECEQTIMKCIWDAGEPIPCSSIIKELKEKYKLDYKDTTVYTFLKNLKEKGFIESERKGITYYTPLRQEEEYRAEILRKTNEFWFNGSLAEYITALVKTAKLDTREKDEIKKIINEI